MVTPPSVHDSIEWSSHGQLGLMLRRSEHSGPWRASRFPQDRCPEGRGIAACGSLDLLGRVDAGRVDVDLGPGLTQDPAEGGVEAGESSFRATSPSDEKP